MALEVVRSEVFRDTYRDSVELMRVAAEIERLAGVRRAALLMATPANRDLLAKSGLLPASAESARPSDLIVAVAADDADAAQTAMAQATGMLRGPAAAATGASQTRPPTTIAAALERLPEANLAIISTPGPYATAEALKALKRGLHVFLFSDNVPLDDEVELKRLAVRKRLLVMGPDCGTAILDGVPLGFANAVRRGRIGFVGASGTGLQQAVCLVDRLGEGVSQVIGVGATTWASASAA
jgi:FdrA protein